METIVGTIVSAVFGSLGAGVIWVIKRGKTPYSEILLNQSTSSDVVGFILISVIGAAFYFLQ